jgi:hypothetical protein
VDEAISRWLRGVVDDAGFLVMGSKKMKNDEKSDWTWRGLTFFHPFAHLAQKHSAALRSPSLIRTSGVQARPLPLSRAHHRFNPGGDSKGRLCTL